MPTRGAPRPLNTHTLAAALAPGASASPTGSAHRGPQAQLDTNVYPPCLTEAGTGRGWGAGEPAKQGRCGWQLGCRVYKGAPVHTHPRLRNFRGILPQLHDSVPQTCRPSRGAQKAQEDRDPGTHPPTGWLQGSRAATPPRQALGGELGVQGSKASPQSPGCPPPAGAARKVQAVVGGVQGWAIRTPCRHVTPALPRGGGRVHLICAPQLDLPACRLWLRLLSPSRPISRGLQAPSLPAPGGGGPTNWVEPPGDNQPVS